VKLYCKAELFAFNEVSCTCKSIMLMAGLHYYNSELFVILGQRVLKLCLTCGSAARQPLRYVLGDCIAVAACVSCS
jgi:hypothetical protein